MGSPGFHLWNASQQWSAQVARALEPAGLTHTQFFVLGAIRWLTKSNGAPPNQREVGELARLDKVLTSNAARALELLGAIERKDDPEDSRAWRLSVTEKGQKVFAEALASVKAVDARFFGPKADRLRDELAKLPLDSGAD